MGTQIRPELSEKNLYWIDRHRYYELKHFCLQYPWQLQSAQTLQLSGPSPGHAPPYPLFVRDSSCQLCFDP